jgi:hypothetical protein
MLLSMGLVAEPVDMKAAVEVDVTRGVEVEVGISDCGGMAVEALGESIGAGELEEVTLDTLTVVG